MYDRIILQIASEPALSQEDEERLRRLLRLCSLKHGLVVNFGATTLETRKIVL